MIRTSLMAVLALGLVGAGAEAARRRPAHVAPPAAVAIGKGRYGTLASTVAGSEVALTFEGATLGRPFGAELVDSITVMAPYRVGERDIYLVRGRRGEECPARYVAVSVDKQGATPVLSSPFGSCNAITAATVVPGVLRITAPDANGAPVTYFVDGDSVREAGIVKPAPAAIATGAACRLYRRPQAGATAGEANALLASFRADYPAELRKRRSVEKAALAPAQLQDLVTGLACLSTWPGADPLVADTARPLFASKRYGAQAFAMLDAVGHSRAASEPLRAASRAFASQMYFQISLN